MTETGNNDDQIVSAMQDLQQRNIIERMDELLLEGTGSLEEYVALVSVLRLVADSSPTTSSEKCTALSTLGLALERLYDKSSDIAHLRELIIVRQEALHLVSDTDINIGSSLTDLANSLSRQWEKSGSIEHLDQAIAVYQDAVTLTSPTHRNRANGRTISPTRSCGNMTKRKT